MPTYPTPLQSYPLFVDYHEFLSDAIFFYRTSLYIWSQNSQRNRKIFFNSIPYQHQVQRRPKIRKSEENLMNIYPLRWNSRQSSLGHSFSRSTRRRNRVNIHREFMEDCASKARSVRGQTRARVKRRFGWTPRLIGEKLNFSNLVYAGSRPFSLFRWRIFEHLSVAHVAGLKFERSFSVCRWRREGSFTCKVLRKKGVQDLFLRNLILYFGLERRFSR